MTSPARSFLPSLGLAALGLLLAGTPADAKKQPPRVEYDESFDFSSIRTYDFFRQDSKQTEGTAAEALLPKLERLVEAHLATRGFERSAESPDFLITFDGHMSDNLDLYGGYRSAVTKNVVWETYTPWRPPRSSFEGLLIIHMKLAGQKDSFWGAGDVVQLPGTNKPDKVWKKIEKLAIGLLDLFPPQ